MQMHVYQVEDLETVFMPVHIMGLDLSYQQENQ
jgi:hypothetical protein